MSKTNAFIPPPDDAPCVDWPNNPQAELGRYCTYVQIGDRTSLCEYKDGEYYYSITLEADETPLVVCALDRYLTDNFAGEANVGRRCDYVCVGWYNGECFVVFIELRKEMDVPEHWEDKLDQVTQTIVLLCNGNQTFGQQLHSNIPVEFHQAFEPMPVHKTLGLIIPAERSKARAEQSDTISISDTEDISILVIPNRVLRDRQIAWSALLGYAIPPRPYHNANQ